MTAELDAVYRSQRLRLTGTIAAAAASAWSSAYRDRERAVATLVPLVEAGQAQTVALVSGYMTAKALSEGERAVTRALERERYTTTALRGLPAAEIYGRPFGALAGQLAQGAEFAQAFASSRASLDRLVRTDLQLAQTHAARDWMAGEERVVGYRRVLGPGKNCPLCISASTRTYFKAELLPIHERCHCSVSPLFGSAPVKSVGTKVRVVDDPELGARLVDENWAAAA